ncbi:hypothetical protein CYMTET_17364 [Cymbomonas tetramitiformis]|uniref:Uncharacterized protein n=1 Tax=Cymbomonas tetramitiformis TaxID=36881 RepID=A0AAE0GAJ0_9CHLO|nr:hypothetical protein CYMTET_17364 [Cymbomonas tetramitiformis]
MPADAPCDASNPDKPRQVSAGSIAAVACAIRQEALAHHQRYQDAYDGKGRVQVRTFPIRRAATDSTLQQMENTLLAMKDTIEAAYAANIANLASLKEKLKNRPDVLICTKCKKSRGSLPRSAHVSAMLQQGRISTHQAAIFSTMDIATSAEATTTAVPKHLRHCQPPSGTSSSAGSKHHM